MFSYTRKNIFENYIISKKCLIKVWTWFFQLQLPSSSVRPDFLMLQKMKTYFFKKISYSNVLGGGEIMDKCLMQSTFKFVEDAK